MNGVSIITLMVFALGAIACSEPVEPSEQRGFM